MAEWLHAKKLIIAEPGIGFVGTEYNLAKEGISLKADPHILDIIASHSEEPIQRIDIGATLELKAVLEGIITWPANRDNALEIFDNKDVAFVVQMSDDIEKFWFITKVTIQRQWDLAFKGNELSYVPIVMKTTDESILDILIEDEILGEDPGLSPDEFELLTEDEEILTGFIEET